jgi:inosine-uridine nucleoside N-ribohydrolase
MSSSKRIPVILDTDIGGDIDDTWALAMMLKSPELDIRLITSATGDTFYRAKINGRMLEVAGRSDIPMGIGIQQSPDGPCMRQYDWVRDYALDQYPGRVHANGVDALIRVIMDSPEPVTLIAIGPLINIAEALRRESRIAGRTRLVAMAGSIALHHTTNLALTVVPGQIAEWNLLQDIPSAQVVFSAPWHEVVITPLDTCAYAVLEGTRYDHCQQSIDPVMQAVIENYRMWSRPCKPDRSGYQSSVLFDTVAIHLAYTTRHLQMQKMRLIVDDQGFTREAATGQPVHVAIAWSNLDGYLDELTERLLGPVAS